MRNGVKQNSMKKCAELKTNIISDLYNPLFCNKPNHVLKTFDSFVVIFSTIKSLSCVYS